MELDPLERGISILRERYAGALKLLLMSVGLLLLMVCANVTGLLLTRVAGRREEIAVRLALGATRGRLARQMLTESFLLTGLGAAGGVLLAFVLNGSVVRVLPPLRDIGARRLALSVDFGPDWRVLLFALAISVLTALLSGAALALGVSRTSVDSALRERAREWRVARPAGSRCLPDRALHAAAHRCGSPRYEPSSSCMAWTLASIATSS